MKILMLCKSLPNSFQGGVQTHVWKLSEHLIRIGHDVWIVCGGSLKKGQRQYSIEGRTIVEIPYLPGRKSPVLPTLLEELSFNAAAALWTIRNQRNFDIIHLHGRSGSLYGALPWIKKPVVLQTVHGILSKENKVSANQHTLTAGKKWHENLANRLDKRSYKQADALISVSAALQNDLVEQWSFCGDKTTVVYNGIDVQTSKIEVETDPNLLLYVGRLEPEKGIFELVEAMKQVPETINLVMVGGGTAKSALETAIQKAGLSARIQLTGALPAEGVREWMAKCYALILPSYYETQGIVLLEANIAGKPVIANKAGGMPEMVDHGRNGLLMDNNKTNTIAYNIAYLFQRPGLAKAMGELGMQWAGETFAWRKIALQTAAIYAEQLLRRDRLYPISNILC